MNRRYQSAKRGLRGPLVAALVVSFAVGLGSVRAGAEGAKGAAAAKAGAPAPAPAKKPARPYDAAELKALGELGQDAARFKRAAQDYRKTVDQIVRRAYQFRRKKLLAKFEGKIRKEESEERTRRIAAITLFEDFLRRYPNDRRWTPDVIFRLAELYFEKSNDEYLRSTETYEEDLRRFEAKQIAQAPAPPKQDYSQTIHLHRKLIREWPRYRLVDGAYYLLGFCLSEMGELDRGNEGFLALTCANKYRPPLADTPAAKAAGAPPPPLTAGGQPSLNTTLYKGCKPLRKESRFNAEAWVRIGEFHFDENQLGEAIAAYERVLDLGDKDNPYYDEALYKLAWTYYRADRFIEGIKQFDNLVVYADKEYVKTGKYGSEMRPEAIQYLGISFAEDDWDGDTVPDPETGLQRIERFYQGRDKEKHVYEVYGKLAGIYFDTTKYDQAVGIYKLMLRRWPYRSDNPEIQDKVILALERQQKFEVAIKEREEFTRLFGKGTEWEKRNRNNLKALRKAREYDEQALIQAAVFHHKAGQDLKKRGVAMSDGALLQKAATEYALAAEAYKKYLARFPETKNSYEIRYSLADCLFYSERFAEAAKAYAVVRDSNLDDRYRDDAAFMATKAYEELINREKTAGRLTEPALPSGKDKPGSLKPIAVPKAYAEWQKALDEYGKLLPKSSKTPRLVYKAAEISYRHAQFKDARKRFAAIFDKHCGDVMAVNAGQAILVTYQLEKNLDEMEKWATKMQGKCVKDAKGAGNVVAGSKLLLDGIKFKRARMLHAQADKLMKAGKAQEAAPIYDKAAAAYLGLVERSPTSPDADKALNNAAVCYEQSRRFESATKIYERVWQKYPKSPLAGDAIWRAAINYERFFEFSKAVTNYLILADSPRFKGHPQRVNAVFNAARLLENDQAYDKAAKLFLRYSSTIGKPKEAAQAYFQAGLIYEKMKNFSKMMKIFREFPRTHGMVPGMASKAVEGSFRIGTNAQKRGDWRTAERYYRLATAQYSSSGARAGSDVAEYAAYAAFQVAEHKLEKFLKKTLKGSLTLVDRGRRKMEAEAVALKNEYERIWDYKRARWTLGAMYRQGTIMEHFAKTVAAGFRKAPVPKKVKRLGQEAVDIYMEQVDAKLDEVVRPLEEQAKKLYKGCVDRAKGFGVSNKYTESALERLNAFDPQAYPILKRARVEVVIE